MPETLYVAEKRVGEVADLVDAATDLGVRVLLLEKGVLEKIADTVTPQPLLGVFACEELPLEEVGDASLVLVMVDVRDPGNFGTLVRSADAAGFSAVVTTTGTVDPYNPKAVRSSAGSIFHVPLVRGGEAASTLSALKAKGLRVVATTVRAKRSFDAYDWRQPSAVVVGNEANGLPSDLVVTERVHIPMAGRAESLNVSMAATLVCFEAMRQRARL